MLSTFFQTLAVDYDYDPYTTLTTDSSEAAAAGMGVFWFFYFVIIVLSVVCMWRIFTKAGKPGWAAIVPIYNMIVWLQIVGRPLWWIVLLFIPFVNIIVSIIVTVDLAKAFGKDVGYAIGLILLPFIFLPMLAFGKATYHGPGGSHHTPAAPAAPSV